MISTMRRWLTKAHVIHKSMILGSADHDETKDMVDGQN